MPTTYYIDPANGQDYYSGLAPSAAFQTLVQAHSVLSPGDTLLCMNGTYIREDYGQQVTLSKSGTAIAPITIKNYPGHSPKFRPPVSTGSYNVFKITGSYWILEGLEVEGYVQTLTYNGALASSQAYDFDPKYNGNGIGIDGRGLLNKPHHITIRNCKVHDNPGGGLSFIHTDYVTVEGCEIYNNAWYGVFAASGLSLFYLFNFDSDIKNYRNKIIKNKIYGNKALLPWINTGALSDGNGIILDTFDNDESGSTGVPYVGKTLVANNLSFKNGGSGIHTFRCKSGSVIDILHNTCAQNSQVLDYGEIYASDSSNVRIANNIMYARTGKDTNKPIGTQSNIKYEYNLHGNITTPPYQASTDRVGNPNFTDLANDNYTLGGNSPASNNAIASVIQDDILGNPRPNGRDPDMGCYEG